MSIPVSYEYLLLAMKDECHHGDTILRHQAIGNLRLPPGGLVACDPLVFPETEPFDFPLPMGTFPVILSIAHLSTDQRVAFATVRFNQSNPVEWDMLTVPGQDTSELEESHFFGYAVDSGIGCFMGVSAARSLCRRIEEQNDFYETIISEMDKTHRHTRGWADIDLDGANLIAFSSGYGDGVYATYVGVDADNNVAVVVTDLGVVSG